MEKLRNRKTILIVAGGLVGICLICGIIGQLGDGNRIPTPEPRSSATIAEAEATDAPSATRPPSPTRRPSLTPAPSRVPTVTASPTATRPPAAIATARPSPPASATVEPSPAPSATPQPQNCDPAYPDVCIPPPPPDLNCGDIPYRRFRVLPPDPHGFDGNKDGIGCES